MGKFKYIAASVVATMALVGCGGSDGGSTPTDTTQTGTFVDAPVAGLGYQTPTVSGTTDANGQFKYKAGEKVTFKLGDVAIGSVDGSSIVTPKNLGNDTVAANIAYILQNLDTDGDPTDDVIKLPSAEVIKTYLTTSGVTTLDLANNATVTNLVSGLKAHVETQLHVDLPDVNATEALENMTRSLLQKSPTDLLLNTTFYVPVAWGDEQEMVIASFNATKSKVSIKNINNNDLYETSKIELSNNALNWTDDGGDQTELRVVDATDKGLLVYDKDIVDEVKYKLMMFYNSIDDAQAALNYTNSFTSDMLNGKTFYITAEMGDGVYKKVNLSFSNTQFTFSLEGQSATYDYSIDANGVITFNDAQDGAQEWHLLAQTDKGYVTTAETDPDNGVSPESVLLWYTNEADRDAAYAKLPH